MVIISSSYHTRALSSVFITLVSYTYKKMDRSSVFNTSKTRDEKAYLKYLVESNLKIVKGCTNQLNSTKNIADDLGTKIVNQGEQIKGE